MIALQNTLKEGVTVAKGAMDDQQHRGARCSCWFKLHLLVIPPPKSHLWSQLAIDFL